MPSFIDQLIDNELLKLEFLYGNTATDGQAESERPQPDPNN